MSVYVCGRQEAGLGASGPRGESDGAACGAAAGMWRAAQRSAARTTPLAAARRQRAPRRSISRCAVSRVTRQCPNGCRNLASSIGWVLQVCASLQRAVMEAPHSLSARARETSSSQALLLLLFCLPSTLSSRRHHAHCDERRSPVVMPALARREARSIEACFGEREGSRVVQQSEAGPRCAQKTSHSPSQPDL